MAIQSCKNIYFRPLKTKRQRAELLMRGGVMMARVSLTCGGEALGCALALKFVSSWMPDTHDSTDFCGPGKPLLVHEVSQPLISSAPVLQM